MVAIAIQPTTDAIRRPPLRVVPPQAARRTAPSRSMLVAALLSLAALGALAYLALTPSVGTGAAARTAGTHVVAEGETMWSVAVEHAPAGEAATYVEELVAANGGASVTPGTSVVLPAP